MSNESTLPSDRRRTERGAGDRADRVRQQRLTRARQRAVAHQPRLRADADQRADRIEERQEKEDEHDGDQAGRKGAGDVELQPGRRDRWRTSENAVELHEAERQRRQRARQNPPQECAWHTPRRKRRRQRQRRDRQERRPAVQVAERDQRSRRSDDEAGPLESNRRDQQADAGGDRMLQRLRNRRDQPLAQTDAGGEDEDRPCDCDAAERHAPRHLHRDDDRIGEEEVVSHRRRNRDRVVREERHQRRRQRGRQACGGQDGAEVHPRRAQDGRLYEDDIRHRQKRRDAGDHFGPNGRAIGGQREAAIEKIHGRDCSQERATRPSYSARSVDSGLCRRTSRLERTPIVATRIVVRITPRTFSRGKIRHGTSSA